MRGQEEDPGVVRAEDADLTRTRRLLEQARAVSGSAAYAYFFGKGTPDARAAYVAALATEDEVEALLEALEARADGLLEAPPPDSAGT